MFDHTITILILLLFSGSLDGQELIRLFYNSDWQISKEDKSGYYRQATFDLSQFKLDGKVFDYTLSDTLVMEGNYRNGKRDGKFTFYDGNGNVRCEGEYKDSRRVGTWKYFYANSKPKQVVIFNGENDNDFSVLSYYSQEGKQYVEDGTGTWVNDSIQTGIFDRKSFTILTGQFKDGLKHGKWTLKRIADDKLMHSEQFKEGEFVTARIYNPQFDYYGKLSSEVLDKFPDENRIKLDRTEKFELDSTVFSEVLLSSDVETIFKTITGKEYQIQDRVAGYIYGDHSLLEFISRNLKYPLSALNEGISGKVIVNVVVEASGKTGKVTLLKGIHEDLDQEALRVVRLVDGWLPAMHDGKAFESTIAIPVTFEINR